MRKNYDFNTMISFLLFDIYIYIYQNKWNMKRMNSNINTKNNLYKIWRNINYEQNK